MKTVKIQVHMVQILMRITRIVVLMRTMLMVIHNHCTVHKTKIRIIQM